MENFEFNLATGREWEIKVSAWLQKNKKYVLDVYEYNGDFVNGNKSPKLKILPSDESLILPDLQVAASGSTHWVEVKSKSSVGFPFKENKNYRTTGFGTKYWEHYNKVQEVTGLSVIVFFVHYNQGEIRAASIKSLDSNKRKFINNKSKMIYWPYDEIEIVAKINENREIFGLN